jgi:hypothetical protein
VHLSPEGSADLANAMETARSELYAGSDDDASAGGLSAWDSLAKRSRLDSVVTRHDPGVRSCGVQQPEPASWLLGRLVPRAPLGQGHGLRQGSWQRGQQFGACPGRFRSGGRGRSWYGAKTSTGRWGMW